MTMLRYLFVASLATIVILLEASAGFGQGQAPGYFEARRTVAPSYVEPKRSPSPALVAAPSVGPPLTYDEAKRETNDIAVAIVVSGLTCTCARFAEDIRNVINDLRPDGVRVLPVLGVGGLQNLNDVLFLKGMDMGVGDEDNLRLLKKRDPLLYASV